MKNTPNINTVESVAVQNLKNMTAALNFPVELNRGTEYQLCVYVGGRGGFFGKGLSTIPFFMVK